MLHTPHAARRTPHSERGVALVITLVLLSIITFMTVTFLVVSRSQHGAVATETDQNVARLAADTARERAIAELLAAILVQTNEFQYGLLVSTNYINADGFDPGVASPTNVNYDYTRLGVALSPNDQQQNLANLLYNPRAPVFITTNVFPIPGAPSNEFRFFIDVNRNGRDDPNGLQPVIVWDPLGNLSFYDLSGKFVPYSWPPPPNIQSNIFIGDPEWIGGLQHPEFAHSANNLFTHRYAYLVVPAGQTLDLNTIHNYAKSTVSPGNPNAPWPDQFLRNQGILTAEMNLAAFLVDLNTNQWPGPGSAVSAPYYNYTWGNLALANSGAAFDDAASLLRYRYSANLSSLANVRTLYGQPGVDAFTGCPIDGYSEGPVMTGSTWTPPGGFITRVNFPWAGADNPNHFYSPQDLFDRNKLVAANVAPGTLTFVDRLLNAGTNTDSYNRYTFYRLLSQLGTDSAPEPGGKMNLNYCNVDNNGYVVPNKAASFIAWGPAQFFTNAAIRLLADAGYSVGPDKSSTSNLLVLNWVTDSTGRYIPVTNLNIQVWPTNFYTPNVHRLLQLAANMYDATTNRIDMSTLTPYLPTVFRPIFSRANQTSPISIIGYREVTAADTPALVGPSSWQNVRDLTDDNDFKAFDPTAADMIYGIPLVIGARKGFPNFNKMAMEMQAQVTRKLQFHRPLGSATAPVNEIDQMFVVGVSNRLGVEAWNSYATNFVRAVQLVVFPDIGLYITNRDTGKLLNASPLMTRYRLVTPVTTNIAVWPGYDQTESPPSFDFQVPLVTNIVFLTNMTYSRQGPPADAFVPLTGIFERTGTTNFYALPHLEITFKPRLRFAIVDTVTQRLIDYVNLADNNVLDLPTALTTGGQCGNYIPDGSNGSMWCTNRMYGADPSAVSVATFGIQNQIEASMGHLNNADWNSSTHEFPSGMDKTAAINFFRDQFIPGGSTRSSNTFNAPFQPFRNVYLTTAWQANDPLVHYTVGDLVDLIRTNQVADQFSSTSPRPTDRLGQVSLRYAPWGGGASGSASKSLYNLAVKDPLILNSDFWDFPTNKFPNAGWLGRIHRGTPWQTVYLKSSSADFNDWKTWSGNGLLVTNIGQFSPGVALTKNAIPPDFLYQIQPTTDQFTFTNGLVAYDGFFSQPTNDWHVLDLFTAALNDNATRGQLSINQTNLAAWSAALSGVIALTNNLGADGQPVLDANEFPMPPVPLEIQPAGVYDTTLNPLTWPPIARLVKAINDARTAHSNRHVFSRLSDLLSVPELTVASPFLNTNASPATPIRNGGLNDAAYERLPQQIAGLLKADSVPRFVIYAYGQTLKPESTRAIVKSGTFAGLCTNYQIVAESATRTVVRFEGAQPQWGGTLTAITNLHPIIESFNVLPPD